MAVILKKFILKLSALLLVLFFVLLRIADFTFTRTLNRHPEAIKSLLKENLDLTVQFKRADLSLFGGLKFRDLLLYKDDQLIAQAKVLKLGFSVLALLRKELVINRIVLKDVLASTSLTQYQDQLFSKLKELSTKNEVSAGAKSRIRLARPKIYVKGLKILLGEPARNRGVVLVDFRVKFKRENLLCSAVINFADTDFERSLLRSVLFYKFSKKIKARLQVAFMQNDLLVNNLVLAGENLKITGTGIIYNFRLSPVMDIKFVSIPLNLKEFINLKSKVFASGLINIVANLKGGVNSFGLETEMMMAKSEFYLPNFPISLSNVFCNIYFKNNEIVFKELSALVNYRYPVVLQGKISQLTQPELNFTLEALKIRQSDILTQETNSWVFRIDSQLQDQILAGNIGLDMLHETRRPNYKLTTAINSELNNFKFSLDRLASTEEGGFDFRMAADSLSIFRQEILNEKLINSQELDLDNLSSRLLVDNNGGLALGVRSFAYRGLVEADGRWDFYRPKETNLIAVKFVDLSVADLKKFLPVRADISGKLNGVLYLSGRDQVSLDGAINITEGKINKLDLIDNIADFLNIKSIKELTEVFLVTDFSLSQSLLKVKRFNLHNDKIDLQSDFTMNEKGWLVGEAALRLPRDVLEESDIMRRLLSMAGEKDPKIDFDFRVSGFPHALRVELLEGEFRQRLINALRSGIRNQIEKEIDKAISSFNVNSAR